MRFKFAIALLRGIICKSYQLYLLDFSIFTNELSGIYKNNNVTSSKVSLLSILSTCFQRFNTKKSASRKGCGLV